MQSHAPLRSTLTRGRPVGPPPLRRLRSAAGRVAREAALWPRIAAAATGPGPSVAFLPSEGPVGASLLRAYNIAHALRAHGWRSLVIPPHLRLGQRQRILGVFRPDLVVVQQCRHPLNRVAHLDGRRLVLDIDDADFLDSALRPELDAMATVAAGVICGSRFIRDWAATLNGNTVIVWTGTPPSAGTPPEHAARAPIVTWAQASPLGYAAEFDYVRDVVKRVAARTGTVRFRLYGWDGQDDHPALADLRAAGVSVDLLPFMPYPAFVASLREVAVGLSAIVPRGFSQGKSFGKILGYLDADVPVICSDAADHALFFAPGSGVVSNDPEVWAEAVADLLADPARRSAMAAAARARFLDELSLAAAARKVHAFLAPLTGRALAPPAAGVA
ncbi:MAG: glycosyltransferase [Gemmobacter sp.]